jgi:hypothetical protein
MYKKTITYVDFNGVEREEDFYFHMTKAEAIKAEFSEKGTLTETINRISKEEDTQKLFELFEKIVRMSYGKRSVDGRSFIKKQEYADEFISSEAYSNMFMEFMEDPNSAAAFVNGILASIEKNPDRKSMSELVTSAQNNIVEVHPN